MVALGEGTVSYERGTPVNDTPWMRYQAIDGVEDATRIKGRVRVRVDPRHMGSTVWRGLCVNEERDKSLQALRGTRPNTLVYKGGRDQGLG